MAEHNDGMKVSSLNIAQVKRKCGIELGENYNLPKSEGAKGPVDNVIKLTYDQISILTELNQQRYFQK